MSEKRLLVIGAHSADFVWRAAGTAGRACAPACRVGRGRAFETHQMSNHPPAAQIPPGFGQRRNAVGLHQSEEHAWFAFSLEILAWVYDVN